MIKGQKKIFDEFAWIIIAAVGFVLVITMIFTSTSPKPIIEPKNLEFTIARGDSHSFSITVKSEDGSKMSNVTLTALGEISSWITFDRNNFDVENFTNIKVRIDVPKSAALRTYTGSIKAETSGGSSAVSIKVIVSNVTIVPLESRPIFLGDFKVRFTKGVETVGTEENIEVTKGGFSESKETFTITIPADKLAITTDARMELFVSESNKKGNLIIEFNGIELYNKKTDVGKIVIPIDKSLLNTTNIVAVRTTGPSPFIFWSKAVYKIEQLSLVTTFKDVEERERSFSLNQNEINNFHHFVLQGRVTEYSSPLPELIIKINNQIVYADKPPLVAFNKTIEKDILGNRLVLGTQNKISFSFEKEASLDLKDVFLVVYFR